MQNETIVDRVVQRLKTQPLGDLITEEDLHDIVKQAIPAAFFEEQRVPSKHGSGFDVLEPKIFEIMRDLLNESAKSAVSDWLASHGEDMVAYWKNVCDERLLEYVTKIQSELATAQVKTALAPLLNDINNTRSRIGLSYLTL